MVTVCSNMSMTVCSNMSQITGDVHSGEFVEEKHLPFGWHIALRIYQAALPNAKAAFAVVCFNRK